MEPALIGECRLIATLGRGGMADVFLAVRGGMEGFHKLVVVKRLRGELIGNPDGERYRTLLLDEARLAARLGHPNIVQTFEVGEADGLPFLVMEYLDGQPLNEVLAQTRRAGRVLPQELALQIVIEMLRGLAYAHDLTDFDGQSLGVIHRDVSPQNVFWTYDGAIKLLDFGVAKFALNTDDTETGIVKGKLTYMAPEQACGRPMDQRADLFAVGVVMWELITGRRLLYAPNPAASLERLLFGELPPLTRIVPGIDREIARICSRALERDLRARYSSAGEMRDDLERVMARRSPRRPDLAPFLQWMFRDQRAATAQRIRDALAGEAAPSAPAMPDVTSWVGELTPSAARPRRATSTPILEIASEPSELAAPGPGARASAAPRRWPLWLALGAATVAAGVLVDRAPDAGAPSLSAQPTAVAALVAAVPQPEPAALQLCGSNTVGAELAPALVEAFLQRKGAEVIAREPGASHARLSVRLSGAPLVVDIRAAGSATAFTGLADRSCDIGMASRAITDKERTALAAAGLDDMTSPVTEHVIGLDGIAVIVHPDNPLRALDRGQLREIFTGNVSDWSQVGGAPGAITVLARDDNSGTFDTFKHLILGDAPLRAGTRRLADSSALSDQVAREPSAIGFIGLAYVRSAKPLAVGDAGTAAKLPTALTVTTEGYLLSRRLYLYTPPGPRTSLAAELVDFALSSEGQAVVRETGFIDLDVALRDGERCDTGCSASYAALTAHAKRLSLDFRFRAGSDEIDSRASRDLDRVARFLRGYASARLMLLGFSDGAGLATANRILSQDRAATIAYELALRGVHVASVEGLGADMPVAPNTTETERQRNRRVEVWIEVAR